MEPNRHTKFGNEGFSLIELIAVIAVIISLIGFSLPAISILGRKADPGYPLQVIERIHRMQQNNARQFGSAGVIYSYEISDSNGVRPFVTYSTSSEQAKCLASPTKYYVSSTYAPNGVGTTTIKPDGSTVNTILTDANIGGQSMLSIEDGANNYGINLRAYKLTPMKNPTYTFGDQNDVTISFEPRTGLCWATPLSATDLMGTAKAPNGKWVHYLATSKQSGSWSDKAQYEPRYIMEFNRSGHLRISAFRR